MGFTQEEPLGYHDATVLDLIGRQKPRLLVFVGINPGPWAAATQTHFAHPTNRFYPALKSAGITGRVFDRANGLTDEDRDYLLERGVAITHVVGRATAKGWQISQSGLKRHRRMACTAERSRTGYPEEWRI